MAPHASAACSTRSRSGPVRRRRGARGRQPGDGRQRRRAASPAALLPPARDQRREVPVLPEQQRAGALRPAELVAGDRHAVRPERAQIHRDAPGGRDRVDMEQGANPPAQAAAARTGCIVPVSLLASIRQSRAGGPSPAAARALEIRDPAPVHRKHRSPGRGGAHRVMLVAPTMTRRPAPSAAIANASASVPPEVNTTASRRAPNRAATAPGCPPAPGGLHGRRHGRWPGCRAGPWRRWRPPAPPAGSARWRWRPDRASYSAAGERCRSATRASSASSSARSVSTRTHRVERAVARCPVGDEAGCRGGFSADRARPAAPECRRPSHPRRRAGPRRRSPRPAPRRRP